MNCWRYCLKYVAASVLRFMDSPAEQEVRRAHNAILNGKSVDLAGLAAERVGQQLLFA